MAGSPKYVDVTVEGMDELKAGLKGFKRKLQRKTLKQPLIDGSKVLVTAMKFRAPKLKTEGASGRGARWMLKQGARRKGLLKESAKSIHSKIATSKGNAGRFVTIYRSGATKANVAAAGGDKKAAITARKRGQFSFWRPGYRGAKYSPNDPFYFKFLEKGTRYIDEDQHGFIGKTFKRDGAKAVKVFKESAAVAINKLKANQP
jgi:hypothetical protein